MRTLLPLLSLLPLCVGCTMSPYMEGPTLGENPGLLGPDLVEEILIGQFFLGPGDTLGIDVYTHDDLDRSSVIRQDGTVRLHLVGDLPVAGMTLQQAEAEIVRAYDRFLVDPSVIVDVTAWSSQRKVIVIGHVLRNSVLILTSPRTNIIEVLAQSGGVALSGDQTGILIIRKVDGVIQVKPYNLDLLVAPPDTSIETVIPYVQPGDVVYVVRAWRDEFDEVMRSAVLALRAGTLLTQLITGADQVVTVL